jgi:hypothetical protein
VNYYFIIIIIIIIIIIRLSFLAAGYCQLSKITELNKVNMSPFENGGETPPILNLGTSWRRAVRLTLPATLFPEKEHWLPFEYVAYFSPFLLSCSFLRIVL